MKLCPALAALALLLFPSEAPAAERLRVSKNGRFLEYQDGRPFFWLGDTAWQLFHSLNREDAQHYLENRAKKGFTVIQAVALGELGGLEVPNANGDLALEGRDPARPNEAYFRHVDYILERAEKLRLFVGMLPAWGSHWKGPGKRVGAVFTPANAREYGRFLGKRYREKPIVWILGGDANADTPEERGVIDALAAGIREGDGGAHPITFHPRGPGLSSALHKAPWLDFNMYQSSHGGQDHDNGIYAEHDYALEPPKPTLDGEPRYEAIPVGFYFRDFNRFDRFDDYDARQAAYWSLLAGACGHTYGHNSVWQMWSPGRKSAIHADIPWKEALDHPGAFQMGLVRRLFESRPYQKLVPAQNLIVDGPRTGGAKIRAARAGDGSFAFIYSPRGEAFSVDTRLIRGARMKEIWYDPRYGVAHHVHTADTKGYQTYTPPTSGRGRDWVLVLEDADANWPLPGGER